MSLADDHRDMLLDAAIDEQTITEAGVYTAHQPADLPDELQGWGDQVIPALVFPHVGVNGDQAPQIRPDVPPEDGAKYLFPKGGGGVLSVHPSMRDRVTSATDPLVIVEGTKQHLAAVSALRHERYACVGMFGCWGWSRDGKPIADLRSIPLHRRHVYLVLDADRATNPDVYQAAVSLSEFLVFAGAEVRFADVPGAGTSGLDDMLSLVPEPTRSLLGLLERAADNPGRKPPRKRGQYVTADKELRVHTLVQDILRDHHMALAEGSVFTLYRDGVYRVQEPKQATVEINAIIGSYLQNDYTAARASSTREYLAGELIASGKVLGDRPRSDLINVRNGMLNPLTGELHEHDPGYLSMVQHPVVWDPQATCPTYLWWAGDVGIRDQLDDLEESLSLMFDPQKTPRKAVFLFGPSRSGKSTALRIAEAFAGGTKSAVTLSQLANDQFASANLYGSSLNVAAELSAEHLSDLTVFKSITGDDLVQANRKFGRQFTFRNRALFCFSANTIPSVSEGSRAYVNRIKPFAFDITFEDRVDDTIEDRIQDELTGIFVRWVAAYRRIKQRGDYLPTDDDVAARFAQGSDRVAQWVSEKMEVLPARTGDTFRGLGIRDLRTRFTRWCEDNGTRGLGERKLADRLEAVPGVVIGRLPTRQRGYNLQDKRDDEDGEPADPVTNQPNPKVTDTRGTGSWAVSEDSWAVSEEVGLIGGLKQPNPIHPLTCENSEVGLFGLFHSNSFQEKSQVVPSSSVGVCDGAEKFSPETAQIAQPQVRGGVEPVSNSPETAQPGSEPPVTGHSSADSGEMVGVGDVDAESLSPVSSADAGYSGSQTASAGSTVTTGLLPDGSVNPEYRITAQGERGVEVVPYPEWERRMRVSGRWVEPEPGFTWYPLSESGGESDAAA